MKLTRRFLSLLLALCLSVSLVTPAIAAEADPTDETEAVTEETTAATEAPQAEEEGEEESKEEPQKPEEEKKPEEEVKEPETEGGNTTKFLGEVTSEEGSEEEDEETTPAGTQDDPISVEITWNDEYTVGSATVTVPAGTTYWFSVYGSGLILYIDGTKYGTLTSASPRTPALFSITNDGETDAEYALRLTWPVGSQMNPDTMVLGVNEAAVEENSDGYYYTYTAPEDGELTITMGECANGWFYVVNNITAGKYGDNHLDDDEVPVPSETISVTAGDEIQVIVTTNEDGAVTAGTVTFTAEYVLGHKLNPIYPEFAWNDEYTEADVTVTIPAETTQYFAVYADGMDLFINGEYYCRLASAGFRMPATFSISNKAKGEQEFELHLQYPAGSQMNPNELILGANEANVEEDSDGCFYTWTAPYGGNLTITMGDNARWSYGINNITAGTYGDMHYSDEAEPVSSETIAVAKGDKIEIAVSTSTNADWDVPAGTVNFTASFDPLGSATNPINLEFTWNEANTEADATVTIPAETTQFFAVYNADGMDLYIDGEYYCRLASAGFRMPATFSIPNKAKGEQEFELHLQYPVGTDMNPAELVLGENEANVEEDSTGYYFTYTAPEDGDIVITMGSSEHGWSYVVNNITAGTYGDMHYNDDDEPVASETISVTAGDEIQVIVATNEDWAVPAGTVTFTAEYVPGHKLNPIYPEFAWNEDNTEADATVTIPAETTHYFAVYNADGMDLYVGGEFYCRLEAPGFRMPAVFSITNKAKGEQEFELHLEYRVGSEMNPAEMVLGENTADVEEDSIGYFFTYTAPADGELTITMGECEHGWFYSVSNITAGTYGNMHYSDDEVPVASETISVTAGDEIQVIVTTNENPAIPAGTVTFTAEYALGNEPNPIPLEFVWNDDNTEATATVTVPAETTQFFAVYADGMDLYVNGDYYCRLKAAGFRMPAVFSISNKARGEQEFELHLEYPVGSEMNPAELVLGTNVANVEEDSVGYYYTWTAPQDCALTIIMGESAHGWSYVVHNITAGTYGDMHYSDDTPPVASETISVSEGDVIQVIVTTNEDWAVPAGTVTFTAEYLRGSELNPITPDFVWNENNTEADVTVTIPAETTQYFAVYADGMDLFINGEYYCRLEAAGFRMPAVFTITNRARGEQEFELHLQYPAGSQMNPNELILGANEANVEEDSNGCFFTWTAPVAGELTITMGDRARWSYGINNITAGTYGDMHYSDDAVPVSSETITVAKGDKIEIAVSTSTNADWDVPAGTVNFTASFRFFEVTGASAVVAGKTTALKAVTLVGGKTQKVSWSVDDSFAPYASISASGVLTGKQVARPVTVTVVAQATLNGVSYEETHDVTVYPAITKVDIQSAGTYVTDGTVYLDTAETSELALSAVAYPYSQLAAISWKSSNTKVATVEDGKVTALKAGTVTITCTAKDAAGTKTATVKVVIGAFADSVTIGNVPESLRSGSSATLTAEVATKAEGVAPTTAGVTWSISSADSAYASVNASTGKVTAKTVYEKHVVTVVATSKDGRASAACEIVILPKAEQLLVLKVDDQFVTKTTLSVPRGESVQLDAYVMDEFGEVTPVTATWTKSASDLVLTLDENGYVTMRRPATVTITAKYTTEEGNALTATVKVKATNPVRTAPVCVPVYYIDFFRDGYWFNDGSLTLAAGKSTTVEYEVNSNATDKTLTWSAEVVRYDAEQDAYIVCEDEAPLVTVSSKGKLTASKNIFEPQIVRVTAASNSNPEVSSCFYVTAAPAAYAIQINQLEWVWNEETETTEWVSQEVTNTTAVWDMEASDWMRLQAEVFGVDQPVKWKSSNAKVAAIYSGNSVSPDASVVFLKAGTVTFTATANDGSGVKASFTVKVVKNVSSITLQDVNIAGGKSVTMKPVIGPSDATSKKLSWSLYVQDENGAYVSAPATVATLSSTGKLTTKATDEIKTVYVVAKAQDSGGCVGWCEVTIYPATATVTLSYEGASGPVTMGVDETISLDAVNKAADGEATAFQGWTWKSSNAKVASVDADGNVTGLKAGTVTITATAADGSGKKATIKIVVK